MPHGGAHGQLDRALDLTTTRFRQATSPPVKEQFKRCLQQLLSMGAYPPPGEPNAQALRPVIQEAFQMAQVPERLNEVMVGLALECRGPQAIGHKRPRVEGLQEELE